MGELALTHSLEEDEKSKVPAVSEGSKDAQDRFLDEPVALVSV